MSASSHTFASGTSACESVMLAPWRGAAPRSGSTGRAGWNHGRARGAGAIGESIRRRVRSFVSRRAAPAASTSSSVIEAARGRCPRSPARSSPRCAPARAPPVPRGCGPRRCRARASAAARLDQFLVAGAAGMLPTTVPASNSISGAPVGDDVAGRAVQRGHRAAAGPGTSTTAFAVSTESIG